MIEEPVAATTKNEPANAHKAFNWLALGALILLCYFIIKSIVCLWPSHGIGTCHKWCGMDLDGEKSFMVLVALGGMLGAFIHAGTSFVDFIGNGSMEYSWMPWYVIRPAIGASLALIFYFLLRGGVVTYQPIGTNTPTANSSTTNTQSVAKTTTTNSAAAVSGNTGSIGPSGASGLTGTSGPSGTSGAAVSKPQTTIKDTSHLEVVSADTSKHNRCKECTDDTTPLPFNPFGIMCIACLTGLFSKQATDKLREVFETLFKMNNPTQREDPLKK